MPYADLKCFFPTVSERARVLGVRRATVMAWDQGAVSLRSEHRRRIDQLAQACQEARHHLALDRQVGRWMQSPQTFLYGGLPYEYLLEGGELEHLISSMKPAVKRVSPRVKALLNSPAVRAQLEALVAPARREQQPLSPDEKLR